VTRRSWGDPHRRCPRYRWNPDLFAPARRPESAPSPGQVLTESELRSAGGPGSSTLWARASGELRHPDILVVERILSKLAGQPGSQRPTRLQCASETNYTRFERYLGLLEARDLVRIERDSRGGKWVTLTSLGLHTASILAESVAILGVGKQPRLGGRSGGPGPLAPAGRSKGVPRA
jgi:predicted transcriptional regulator